MTTTSNFPSHWKEALYSGFTIGLHDHGDFVAFFAATDQHGCWHDLSADEKANVKELRARFPQEFKLAKAGGKSPAHAANVAAPAPVNNTWAKAIEHVNAKVAI